MEENNHQEQILLELFDEVHDTIHMLRHMAGQIEAPGKELRAFDTSIESTMADIRIQGSGFKKHKVKRDPMSMGRNRLVTLDCEQSPQRVSRFLTRAEVMRNSASEEYVDHDIGLVEFEAVELGKQVGRGFQPRQAESAAVVQYA